MPASGENTDTIYTGEYSIERLTSLNITELSVLYAAVYNKETEKDFFTRKYDTAFTGTSLVGFIAFNRDRIAVAYYGVIPCFINYDNQVMLAAQSADTMTHPDYRYKGMYVELAKRTFELCKKIGIRLLIGFPNQHSYHGAIHKLGWKMTETMGCFIIPVKTIPLAGIVKRTGFLKGIYTWYCKSILKKHLLNEPGIVHSAKQDGFASIQRDKDFLQYKKYSPSVTLQHGRVKTWISIKDNIRIGDFENLAETNIRETIAFLTKIARRLGIRQLQFHCSPGTSVYRIFKTYCTEIPSYPVLFQDFNSPVPPEKVKFTFADIDIF